MSLLALMQARLLVPLVLTAAYAFLSILLEGLCVLDVLSFAAAFYITDPQIFFWEAPE